MREVLFVLWVYFVVGVGIIVAAVMPFFIAQWVFGDD